MTSRSEDYEKGTVIKCGHDGKHEKARLVSAAAEKQLRDAGYMPMIYAPEFFKLFYFAVENARWLFRYEPAKFKQPSYYNAWAPRWIVHSYYAAVQVGKERTALLWIASAPRRTTGKRSRTQAQEKTLKFLKKTFIENELYREASD